MKGNFLSQEGLAAEFFSLFIKADSFLTAFPAKLMELVAIEDVELGVDGGVMDSVLIKGFGVGLRLLEGLAMGNFSLCKGDLEPGCKKTTNLENHLTC